MYAKLKKANKFSDVFPLDGVDPRQMMNDHNADEIHVLMKNGQYTNTGGKASQKWRTIETIKANNNNIMNSDNTFSNPINPIAKTNVSSFNLPSVSPEALQMQVMYLQQQLQETKSDKQRYHDRYEEFKGKFEKVDRELYELKQDHRDEIRNLEKDQESGLNGLMKDHPDLALKAMEIFGPMLANKMGGSNQQLTGVTENTSRQELNELINYLKEIDKQDQNVVNFCSMLVHIKDKGVNYQQTVEFLTKMYNQQ